jgi:hypothetical protein
MGDDIGYWNIGTYNRGMMGNHAPNIDRIANEGAIFTDYYGQQSCTAGRAAFITGQSPLRTGLLKVGLPAAKEGLSEKDPTIAELLKPQGYATDNSARTISATATSSCRRSMAGGPNAGSVTVGMYCQLHRCSNGQRSAASTPREHHHATESRQSIKPFRDHQKGGDAEGDECRLLIPPGYKVATYESGERLKFPLPAG